MQCFAILTRVLWWLCANACVLKFYWKKEQLSNKRQTFNGLNISTSLLNGKKKKKKTSLIVIVAFKLN